MKLHRMPILVKRMIIEELGFDERLFLSFTSKRSCSLLGLFRTDFKPVSITIQIYDWEVSVSVRQISFRLSEHMFGLNISSLMNNDWKFNIPFNQCHVEDSFDWAIDGSTVQVKQGHFFKLECRLDVKRVGFQRFIHGVTLFGKLLRHLNSFFNIQECLQCVFDMVIPVGLISELDCNYTYGTIDISTSDRRNMTPEDLTILLENIKTKRLCLNVNVPSVPGYKYQKNPEKTRSIGLLEIQNYSWVDFSELPSAKCLTIQEKIHVDQVNMMLKSWVAGRNQEMEIGKFEIAELTDLNRNIIFTDIETHATLLTEAEIDSFFNFPRNLSSRLYSRSIVARDILRESDGTRATVVEATICFNPKTYQKVLVMVWSEGNLQTIGRAKD